MDMLQLEVYEDGILERARSFAMMHDTRLQVYICAPTAHGNHPPYCAESEYTLYAYDVI